MSRGIRGLTNGQLEPPALACSGSPMSSTQLMSAAKGISLKENRMNSDDKPGYKRPPRTYQFKPGQSGNPQGRPKGTRNVKTDLAAALNRLTAITIDGVEIEVTGQQAFLLKLVAQASGGNIRAAQTLLNADRHYFSESEPEPERVLSEDDQKVLEDFIRCLRASEGKKP